MPAGVRYTLLNVLADAKTSAPAELEALLHDPKKANDVLGGGKIEAMFMDGYLDDFVAAGGDRSIAEAVFGVKPEYLETAFDEMQQGFGTIETYFTNALGMDAEGRKALIDRFLVQERQARSVDLRSEVSRGAAVCCDDAIGTRSLESAADRACSRCRVIADAPSSRCVFCVRRPRGQAPRRFAERHRQPALGTRRLPVTGASPEECRDPFPVNLFRGL